MILVIDIELETTQPTITFWTPYQKKEVSSSYGYSSQRIIQQPRFECPLVNYYPDTAEEILFATFRTTTPINPNHYSAVLLNYGFVKGGQWIQQNKHELAFSPIQAVRQSLPDEFDLPIWNLFLWLFLRANATINISFDALNNGPPIVYNVNWQISDYSLVQKLKTFLLNSYQLSNLNLSYQDFFHFWAEVDQAQAQAIIDQEV